MKSVILALIALFSTVSAYNKQAITGQIFGQWLFIYDGTEYQQKKGLVGGVPSWMKDGGANLAVFSFLDPIDLEKSADVPQQFLDGLKAVESSTISVIFSIGGYDLQGNFKQTTASQVALNAATIAKKYSVGFEIDCEDDSQGQWVTEFIQTYRQQIPIGGSDMSSILTLDSGDSPYAFENIENAGLKNIDNLDWVNAMVGDNDNKMNEQYWNQHQEAPNKLVVSRMQGYDCNDYSSLSWCLSYKKSGQPIKGIMLWASLSEETCANSASCYYNYPCANGSGECCGTKVNGQWDCPALRQGCKEYLGQCSTDGVVKNKMMKL